MPFSCFVLWTPHPPLPGTGSTIFFCFLGLWLLIPKPNPPMDICIEWQPIWIRVSPTRHPPQGKRRKTGCWTTYYYYNQVSTNCFGVTLGRRQTVATNALQFWAGREQGRFKVGQDLFCPCRTQRVARHRSTGVQWKPGRQVVGVTAAAGAGKTTTLLHLAHALIVI